MNINPEWGGYARGKVTRLYGSFQTNGAGAPTIIRDGHSFLVASVTRISAGLYEVTLDTGFPVPELYIVERAFKSGSATPSRACTCEVVAGSWNKTTRKFRIACTVVGDVALSAYTDPAVGDPDTGDRIGFELVGSTSSPGTDLA